MVLDINSLNNAVVSYYKFDENSGTTASDSKGSNDASVTGASWVPGVVGSGLDFGTDSNDYYARINSIPGFSVNNDFTFGCWCRIDGGSNQNWLFTHSTSTTGLYWGLNQRNDSNGFLFQTSLNSSNRPFQDNTNKIPMDGEFHFVTLERSGSNWELYIDNVLAASDTNSFTDYDMGDIYIGKLNWNNDQFLNGAMDEVFFMNRALTNDERTFLYNSGSPNSNQQYEFTSMSIANDLNTSTISYYKFDEGSGTTASDSKGSLDLTLDGLNWNSNGIVNSGLEGTNTGNNRAYSSATTVGNGDSSFSISVWAKADTISSSVRSGIVSKWEFNYPSNTDKVFAITLFHGKASWILRSGATNHEVVSSSTVNTGVWYHLVVVYDKPGDVMRLYINAVEEASKTSLGTINSSSVLGIEVGNYGQLLSPFDGVIDEPAIFNKVLSQDEINFLYNNGSPGSEQQYGFFDGSLITGVVRLAGFPVSGAVVRCFNTTQDTYVGLSITGGDGVYNFDVDDQDVYHLTVEYFDESTGEKYLSSSKPFINSGGSS